MTTQWHSQSSRTLCRFHMRKVMMMLLLLLLMIPTAHAQKFLSGLCGFRQEPPGEWLPTGECFDTSLVGVDANCHEAAPFCVLRNGQDPSNSESHKGEICGTCTTSYCGATLCPGATCDPVTGCHPPGGACTACERSDEPYDFICGSTPLQECPEFESGPNLCYCDVDTEGLSGCFRSQACSALSPCLDSDDCPVGWRCSTSCCPGGSRCMLPCNFVDDVASDGDTDDPVGGGTLGELCNSGPC